MYTGPVALTPRALDPEEYGAVSGGLEITQVQRGLMATAIGRSVVYAFAAGYAVGTVVNEVTGLSSTIADLLVDDTNELKSQS